MSKKVNISSVKILGLFLVSFFCVQTMEDQKNENKYTVKVKDLKNNEYKFILSKKVVDFSKTLTELAADVENSYQKASEIFIELPIKIIPPLDKCPEYKFLLHHAEYFYRTKYDIVRGIGFDALKVVFEELEKWEGKSSASLIEPIFNITISPKGTADLINYLELSIFLGKIEVEFLGKYDDPCFITICKDLQGGPDYFYSSDWVLRKRWDNGIGDNIKTPANEHLRIIKKNGDLTAKAVSDFKKYLESCNEMEVSFSEPIICSYHKWRMCGNIFFMEDYPHSLLTPKDPQFQQMRNIAEVAYAWGLKELVPKIAIAILENIVGNIKERSYQFCKINEWPDLKNTLMWLRNMYEESPINFKKGTFKLLNCSSITESECRKVMTIVVCIPHSKEVIPNSVQNKVSFELNLSLFQLIFLAYFKNYKSISNKFYHEELFEQEEYKELPRGLRTAIEDSHK